MGVRTGVDIHALIDAGRRAEDILGQRLRSNVIRSGPVIHGESSPDKEAGVKPVHQRRRLKPAPTSVTPHPCVRRLKPAPTVGHAASLRAPAEAGTHVGHTFPAPA